MNKENKIKICIIGIFLIIGLLIICYVLFMKKDIEKDENQNQNNKYFELVDDYILFYFASDNINEYFNEIGNKNIKSVLGKTNDKYISDNKLNENNILNNFSSIKMDYFFECQKVYIHYYNESIVLYKVEGNIINNGYDIYNTVEKNVSFALLIDYSNGTISIYPINNKENDEYLIDILSTKKITNNNYNKFKSGNIIDKNSMCIKYLSNYINLIQNNKEEALNITKNFSNKKEFEQYVEENELNSIIISCDLYDLNGKRIYQIKDNNNNKYKFEESSIMNYTVTISK